MNSSKLSGGASLIVLEETAEGMAEGVPVVGRLRDVELDNRQRLSQRDSRGDVDCGGEWKESAAVASNVGVLLQIVHIRFELSVPESHSGGERVARLVLGVVVEAGHFSLQHCACGVGPMEAGAAGGWERRGEGGGEFGERGDDWVDSQAQPAQLHCVPFDVSRHNRIVIGSHSRCQCGH